MKKIIMFTTILLFGILLVGCGGKVTVKFDLGYEATDKISDVKIKSGGTVTAPTTPKREGYEFEYWTLDNKKFDFKTKVEKNITLVAKWLEEDGSLYVTVEKTTLNIEMTKSEIIEVNHNDPDGVTFNSKDETIATVDSSGKVTGIKEGTTTVEVVAKTMSDVKQVVAINVFPIGGSAPKEIKIMHGALEEVDPFHPNFSGQNQKERQDLQKEVQQRNNVVVKYVMYPSNAGWGPSRVNEIISAYDSGKPMADIYWTTSDWTGTLANSKAITPVSKELMEKYGTNIGETTKEIGSYKREFYGFTPSNPTAQLGLYFNQVLLEKYSIPNPVDLYEQGKWTWSGFETWAKNAQAKLSKSEGTEEYAIGGALQMWVTSLVPLNGGRMINNTTQQIAFNQQPALETYAFLKELYGQNLMEPSGTYDAGSPEWQQGRVLIHPGSFWFLNSSNRWGNLGFNLGFVPYPMSDSFVEANGKYITPAGGEAMYNIANGIPKEQQELAFKVWNELQLWRTKEQGEREFTAILRARLREQRYVDAFLSIYDNVYLELIDALGIGAYTEGGFRNAIGIAIKEGDPRSAVEGIRPAYQAALNTYFGK